MRAQPTADVSHRQVTAIPESLLFTEEWCVSSTRPSPQMERWQRIADEMRLSPRELQIVIGACHGETRGAIGRCLGISVNTVHSYFARMFLKLRVSSRSALLAQVLGAHTEIETRRSLDHAATLTMDRRRSYDRATAPVAAAQ